MVKEHNLSLGWWQTCGFGVLYRWQRGQVSWLGISALTNCRWFARKIQFCLEKRGEMAHAAHTDVGGFRKKMWVKRNEGSAEPNSATVLSIISDIFP